MDSIQEEGVVIETHERTATVRINKAAACAHCKAGCMEQGGFMLAEAQNPVRAETGDIVRLTFEPGAALTAVLVVFGLPLLALLVGVILTNGVASRTGYQGSTELLSIGIGAILFFLTFIPVKLYDIHIKKSGSHNMSIAEILRKANSSS